MREKRNISKKMIITIIILFFVLFNVVTVNFLSKIVFEEIQNEQEIIKNYEDKKEKCQCLKDIAKEVIQEGVGIDTRKITNEEVQYRIYNDNESIIFYYYLQDDSTTVHRYNATITLSNEYRILEEEYSVKLESLNEYIKYYQSVNKYLSLAYSIMIVLAFYFLIGILVLGCCLLFYCIDRKKHILSNNIKKTNKKRKKCIQV